jgi:hypothetical protein
MEEDEEMKWYSTEEVLPEVLEEIPYDVRMADNEGKVAWMEANCPPVLAWLENGRGQLNIMPAPAFYTSEGWYNMITGVKLEERLVSKWAYYPTLAEPQEEAEIPVGTYIPAPQLELVKGMVEIYDATRNANLREQYAAQLVGMLKIVYGITTETYGGPDR